VAGAAFRRFSHDNTNVFPSSSDGSSHLREKPLSQVPPAPSIPIGVTPGHAVEQPKRCRDFEFFVALTAWLTEMVQGVIGEKLAVVLQRRSMTIGCAPFHSVALPSSVRRSVPDTTVRK
jgi:hypothetical protein